MLVAAVKATLEPSEGRARQKARNAASQIVLVGVPEALTRRKMEGMPRSRAKEYIMRELLVREKRPAW